MSDQLTSSLGVVPTTDGLVALHDRSCRSCPACVAGAPLWCDSPVGEGRRLATPIPSGAVDGVTTALLGAAALASAPVVTTVLVLDRPFGPLATLARATVPGRVVAAPDPRDAAVREELARTEPSQRARVVVTAGDVRAAVRAVRRGGHVCVAGSGTNLPSVTELVQREVTLVGPRNVAAVLDRLPETAWSAVVAAA